MQTRPSLVGEERSEVRQRRWRRRLLVAPQPAEPSEVDIVFEFARDAIERVEAFDESEQMDSNEL